MNRMKKSIFYISICCMFTTSLLRAVNQQEDKVVPISQALKAKEVQQITKKPIAMTRKAPAHRVPNKAIGATERRNRLKAREEMRKQMLEKRRALAAQKKAQQASQENDQSKLLTTKKPAAPQNNMLRANVSQAPTILKSPTSSDIKKS